MPLGGVLAASPSLLAPLPSPSPLPHARLSSLPSGWRQEGSRRALPSDHLRNDLRMGECAKAPRKLAFSPLEPNSHLEPRLGPGGARGGSRIGKKDWKERIERRKGKAKWLLALFDCLSLSLSIYLSLSLYLYLSLSVSPQCSRARFLIPALPFPAPATPQDDSRPRPQPCLPQREERLQTRVPQPGFQEADASQPQGSSWLWVLV